MREIKFRAWDDFRKRMLYDVVSFDQCEGYIGINVVTPMTNKITAIMQFTGLKDSEDVEIWEGDTVRVCIEQLFDDVENIESEAMATVNGETIPYRELRSKLYKEKDAEKRKALNMAADPVLETLNVKYLETEKLNQTEAKKLGYPSYVKMCEDLKFLRFEKFKELAQNYLQKTNELYTALL